MVSVLISIPVLRMNTGTMCIYARKQSYRYSKVDAVEQRHMVNSNSGVGGKKKDRNRRSGWIGILL
jgi:hypothetical protein